MRRTAWRAALVAALVAFGAESRAELYRWTDDEGVVHYATDRDRIPRRYRSQAQVVRSDAPVAPPGGPLPPLAGQPTPAPAPSAAEPELPREPESVQEPAQPPEQPAEAPPPAVAPEPDAEPDTAPSSQAAPGRPAPAPEETPAVTNAPPPPPPAAPRRAPLPPDDPRAAEAAELEREIAARQEEIRQLISQNRWEGSELATDPRLRELGEVLPRLQAELEALRGELER